MYVLWENQLFIFYHKLELCPKPIIYLLSQARIVSKTNYLSFITSYNCVQNQLFIFYHKLELCPKPIIYLLSQARIVSKTNYLSFITS